MLIIYLDFFIDVIVRKVIKYVVCMYKISFLFLVIKCYWLNIKVMKIEFNVVNSLVLNCLVGRSKNNNEIVSGFNKKIMVLVFVILIFK